MKRNRVIKKNKANYDESLVKAVKILGILILLFVIIYIGTAIVTGDIKLKKEEEAKEEVSIQNEEILAGSTFKMKEKDYIVFYYDYTSVSAGIYDALYSDYNESEKNVPKMYKVDLSKGFNKAYVSSEEKLNTKPSNVDELQVKNPTLIRIKNNKVVKFITSRDDIKKYINDLI